LNELAYSFAVWLDDTAWSTQLHESFYLYNWIETTHVLTLTLSLGLLLVIDLRMLGLALPDVPARHVAARIQWPMLIGFTIMVITGVALFYAIPVRSSQSLWLRLKVVLLVAAALNAFLFHRRLNNASPDWDSASKAPAMLRRGAALSIVFWVLIVICGRLIAYDWFDCAKLPSPLISLLAGCIDDQQRF
jgi:hypothetical protein